MQGYKKFSRKYYTEDVIKRFSKHITQHSSYIGATIHDKIEGRNHENDAWRYGGSGSMGFTDGEFNYTIIIQRKSRKEKEKDN